MAGSEMEPVIDVLKLLVLACMVWYLWRGTMKRKDPLEVALAAGATLLVLDFLVFIANTPLSEWVGSQPWAVWIDEANTIAVLFVLAAEVALAVVAFFAWRRRGRLERESNGRTPGKRHRGAGR